MQRRRFLKVSAIAALARCVRLPAQITETHEAAPPPGARRLICHWQRMKNRGKYACDLATTNKGPFDFTQLFVNGKPQILARYPHATPSGETVFVNGVRFLPQGSIIPDFGDAIRIQDLLAIEFDPANFGHAHWGSPQEIVLCLKTANSMVRIPVLFIDYDRNLLWCKPQNGPASLDTHSTPQFYVENVYEALKLPHEWYLNRQLGTLYYETPQGFDINTAVIDVL